MDFTPSMGDVITMAIALIGFYGMVSTRLAKTETKLDDLAANVDKHNGVIERTFKLESDMNTAFKRIDELKARDDKLEAKVEKLHAPKGSK